MHKGTADEMRCSGFTWMRCTLRRQTAGVAEATLRFVDDERTAQTREDGVLNSSVVPLFSRRTIIEFYPLFLGAIASACHPPRDTKLHAQTSTSWTLCIALAVNPTNRAAPVTCLLKS